MPADKINFRRRWLWGFLGVALLGGTTTIVIFHLGALLDRFAPLDLNERPSFLTTFHLMTLQFDPEHCFDALNRRQIEYQRVAAQPMVRGCGYDHAALLGRSDVSYGSRILLR